MVSRTAMCLAMGKKLDESSNNPSQKNAAPKSVHTPSGTKSAGDKDYITYRWDSIWSYQVY